MIFEYYIDSNEIHKEIIELIAQFYRQIIKEGKLVPALNLLFSMYLEIDKEEKWADPFIHQFWHHVHTSDKNLPLHYFSVFALGECLIEGGAETVNKVSQEIEERKDALLPGIAFHIALAFFLSVTHNRNKNVDDEAVRTILKQAIIDIIQNPVQETIYQMYYSLQSMLPFRLPLSDYTARWDFVNNVIINSDIYPVITLKLALYRTYNLVKAFWECDKTSDCISIYDNYLRSKSDAISALIYEALSKHDEIIKARKSVPSFWHIEFIKQWIKNRRPPPNEAAQFLENFPDIRTPPFLKFCLLYKDIHSYLEQLEPVSSVKFIMNLGYVLSSLDKRRKETKVKWVYMTRVLEEEKFFKNDIAEHILETLERDKYTLSILLYNRTSYMANFVEKFLGYNLLRDVYTNNFPEIHNHLMRLFKSPGARRTAYEILLVHKLRAEMKDGYRSFTEPSMIELINRRFDVEQYNFSTEDVLRIYREIIRRGMITGIYKALASVKRDTNKAHANLYLNNIVDWFLEICPKFDLKEESPLIRDFYNEVKSLNEELAITLRDKFLELGINPEDSPREEITVLFFNRAATLDLEGISPQNDAQIVNKGLRASSLDEAIITNRLEQETENHFKSAFVSGLYRACYRDWQIDIANKWAEIALQGSRTVEQRYIPLIYHPLYGYGLFYNSKLAIIFGKVPTEILQLYPFSLVKFHKGIDARLFNLSYNIHTYNLQEKKELFEDALVGTVLEGAVVEFGKVDVIETKHLGKFYFLRKDSYLNAFKGSKGRSFYLSL